MEKKLADKVVEILDGYGIDAKLYEDYSGRNMFGGTTTGVVSKDMGEICYAIGCASSYSILEMAGCCDDCHMVPGDISWDSLGLDVIVY